MPEQETKNYISLQEAARYCNYSQEYLSLRARQGKLKAIKLGRNWVTTKKWVEDYAVVSDDYKKNGYKHLEYSEKEKPKVVILTPLLAEEESREDIQQVRPVRIAEQVRPVPPENLPAGEFKFSFPQYFVKKPNIRFGFVLSLILTLALAGGVFGKPISKSISKGLANFADVASQSALENGGAIYDKALKPVEKTFSVILKDIDYEISKTKNKLVDKIYQDEIYCAVLENLSDVFGDYGKWLGTSIGKLSFVIQTKKALASIWQDVSRQYISASDSVGEKFLSAEDFISKNLGGFAASVESAYTKISDVAYQGVEDVNNDLQKAGEFVSRPFKKAYWFAQRFYQMAVSGDKEEKVAEVSEEDKKTIEELEKQLEETKKQGFISYVGEPAVSYLQGSPGPSGPQGPVGPMGPQGPAGESTGGAIIVKEFVQTALNPAVNIAGNFNDLNIARGKFVVTSGGAVTAGTWAGTAIATAYGGTGQDFSTAVQGSLLYFSDTGVMASLAPSTAGLVLTTSGAGAAPVWVAAVAGGTPGGSDGQLQYNDGGSFGGASLIYWDDVNSLFGIGDSGPDAALEVVSNADDYFMISSHDSLDGNIFIVDSVGYIGIGTNTPYYPLEILSTATPQLGITYSGTTSATFAVDSTGQLYLGDAVAGVKALSELAAASVAGSDGQIQYNNGGSLGGASLLYWDDVNYYLGVGDATPDSALEVVSNADDYFMISSGTDTDGNILIVDSSGNFIVGSPYLYDDGNTSHDTRMWFDKSRGAFRAGTVTSTQWDSVNVGTNSAAMGINTTASGDYSFVAGNTATASGDYSVAFGYSFATGDYSLSTGWSTTASGTAAVSLGHSNNVSGNYSFSEGYLNTVSGVGSVAMGQQLSAVAANTFAFGKDFANNTASSFMVGFDETPVFTILSDSIGINDTGSDAALEVVSAGDDYFMISSDSTLDGNIFIVDSAGYIGIGTNTPYYPLEILSTATPQLGITYSGTTSATFAVDSTGQLYISDQITGAKSLAEIANQTTSPAGSDGQLQYNNGGSFGGAELYWDDSNLFFGINDTTPDSALEVVSNAGDYFMISSYDDNDGNIFIVDSAGNVGIGTTTPTQRLDLGSGNFVTTGTIYSQADSSKLYFGAGNDAYIEFDGDSMNIVANTTTSTDDLEFTAETYTFKTNADTDLAINFSGTTNSGLLTWMEDEDYVQFSDDILMATTERIYFRDTAIYISSIDDGHLDLTADTSIDLNGKVVITSTSTPQLRVAYDGSNYIDIYHDGTMGHLATDTEGDIYFFDGDTGGENFEVRYYGYITAAASASFAALNLDDTNDEFLIDLSDGNGSTTLDMAVQLDDVSGSSVFRIRDSGSTEIFSISSYGIVGIGDTSPDAMLEMTSAGDDYFMLSSYDGGDGNILLVDSGGNLTIDATTFYVDAVNNRVGVGTITPSTALQVSGIITADSFSGNFGGFTAGSVIFADGSGKLSQDNSNFFWDDTNYYLGIGDSTPDSALEVVSNADDYFMISSEDSRDGDIFIVDSAGNVGIGTATPTQRLDLGSGNFVTTGTIYSQADSSKLYFGAGNDAYVEFDGNSLNIVANTTTSTDDLEFTAETYTFKTNADTDLAINFSGTTNSGLLTWMEDEDYVQFSDDILMATTERIYFRDTAIYISSIDDGHLDLTADTSIDLNGNVEVEGTLIIDVDSTEAFLVRKNGDAGDVFTIDTTNSQIIVGGATSTIEFTAASATIGLTVDTDLLQLSSGYFVVNGNAGINDASADAALEVVSGGADYFMISSGGSVDGNILLVDSAGNLVIGLNRDAVAASNGGFAFAIGNGTEPSASIVNGILLFASDGGAELSELFVRDEAGNITKLSPHNALDEWVFSSYNPTTGHSLEVQMEQLAKFIDQQFGTSFVREYQDGELVNTDSSSDSSVDFGFLNEDGSITPDVEEETSGVEQGLLSSFVQKVKDALAELGFIINDGIAQLKELVVKKLIARTARIEKIEMVDAVTGDIYCTWIERGDWVKVKAECDQVEYLNGQYVVINPEEVVVRGCVDEEALNYNSEANQDDGSCRYDEPEIEGCTDSEALNYNSEATVDDGICEYPQTEPTEPTEPVEPVEPVEIEGCTDSNAINYDSNATIDNGSCQYPPPEIEGCTDSEALNYNSKATTDDNSCQYPAAPEGSEPSAEAGREPAASEGGEPRPEDSGREPAAPEGSEPRPAEAGREPAAPEGSEPRPAEAGREPEPEN